LSFAIETNFFKAAVASVARKGTCVAIVLHQSKVFALAFPNPYPIRSHQRKGGLSRPGHVSMQLRLQGDARHIGHYHKGQLNICFKRIDREQLVHSVVPFD
jgi:hypothetical protein